MNIARSFAPDLVRGDLSATWIYIAGPIIGATIAVGFEWDAPMTAGAPVTDAPAAPAAIVKTFRRENSCDPVMIRRPSATEYQLTSVNCFVLRRHNRAQTR
jgi:hypothetical protein